MAMKTLGATEVAAVATVLNVFLRCQLLVWIPDRMGQRQLSRLQLQHGHVQLLLNRCRGI